MLDVQSNTSQAIFYNIIKWLLYLSIHIVASIYTPETLHTHKTHPYIYI